MTFSYTYSTTPRMLRMAQLLANAGYIVHMIKWNRIGIKLKTDVKGKIVFKRSSLYSSYDCIFSSNGIGYFLLMQLIMIFAWFNYLRGKYNVIWEKAESTREVIK